MFVELTPHFRVLRQHFLCATLDLKDLPEEIAYKKGIGKGTNYSTNQSKI